MRGVVFVGEMVSLDVRNRKCLDSMRMRVQSALCMNLIMNHSLLKGDCPFICVIGWDIGLVIPLMMELVILDIAKEFMLIVCGIIDDMG